MTNERTHKLTEGQSDVKSEIVLDLGTEWQRNADGHKAVFEIAMK